jgi:hypothetical protein
MTNVAVSLQRLENYHFLAIVRGGPSGKKKNEKKREEISSLETLNTNGPSDACQLHFLTVKYIYPDYEIKHGVSVIELVASSIA